MNCTEEELAAVLDRAIVIQQHPFATDNNTAALVRLVTKLECIAQNLHSKFYRTKFECKSFIKKFE